MYIMLLGMSARLTLAECSCLSLTTLCTIIYVSHVDLPPCADPTLNISNLQLVTKSVEKWYDLGWYRGGLGVPETVCNEIRDSTSYQTEEEKKEALLLYYLHNVPMASWPSVAGALHFREEKTASQALKGFLNDTPAGQSSYRE